MGNISMALDVPRPVVMKWRKFGYLTMHVVMVALQRYL